MSTEEVKTTSDEPKDCLMSLWAEIMKLDKDIDMRNKLIESIHRVVDSNNYSPQQKLTKIKKHIDNFKKLSATKQPLDVKSGLRYAVSGGLLN